MGSPKALVRVEGEPLLSWVLAAVRDARVAGTVLVLGDQAERIPQEVDLRGATVVVNDAYREGMSTSLRVGLRAVDPAAHAVLVVLGDQPFVAPETLDALIEAWASSDARIVVPTFRGVRGNPVLLDRSLFAEAERLTGDAGFREVFREHAEHLREVPVDDPGVRLDVDTEAQLARIRQAREEGVPLEEVVSEAAALERDG